MVGHPDGFESHSDHAFESSWVYLHAGGQVVYLSLSTNQTDLDLIEWNDLEGL